MAKVYNWQINRKMEYKYNDKRPKRQVGQVFDINRCIGCQTCTMACRSTWTFSKGQEYMWWNNVETKPFGGYPQHWDVKILSMLGAQKWENGTYKGKTLFEVREKSKEEPLGYLPELKEWAFPNIYEDTASETSTSGLSLPAHNNFFFYLQRICNHCTYPACLAACTRKSIYKRPEDGIVLIDQKRCRGYQECVKACPYKKSMYNPNTGTSEKCISCYPRVEDETIQRCMSACVGHIRLSGWVSTPEEAREDNPIDYLVHKRKIALPLYPQLGTEPNVFYVPPRWVPRDHLLQMFGPGVDAAIEARTNPDPELIAVLKLFGSTQQIIERFTADEEVVKGFGAKGKQVVEVKIEEPFFERPFNDKVNNAFRFNEP